MSENLNDVITKICEDKIEGKKINKQPLCVLLGGLPGAGKTNLIEQVQKEYKERDFVVIDTDDYRELHPDYDELLKTPEKAIAETSDFSNRIEAELIKRAIEKKCDIISVTTLRATEAIDNILYKPALKSGYKMEACIMSVPISESGLSAQYRYENQITNGECPRFTPMSFIEGSYQGIMETIKSLQTKRDDPRIRVFRRGENAKSMPIEIYDSSKLQGNRYSCALEAFMNPTKLLDKKTAMKFINELYHKKRCRKADKIEYSSLERLEELFGIENAKERQ